MDRCPNCGAQVRPDARFCTTCGYRVSDTLATATNQPADQSAAPVATDDAAQAAPGTQAGAAPGTEELADEIVLTAPAAEPPATVDAGSAGGSWPSSWNTWASNQESAEATADTTAGDTSDGNPSRAEAVADTSGETADTASAGTADGEQEKEVVAIGTIEPAQDTVATTETTGASVDGGSVSISAATNGSPLDQALSLVDQLRALLPELATAPAAASPTAGVADDLAAARDGADPSQADEFAKLRDTVSAARAQPRDIDTMLQLVGSLDTIAALQDRYDQLGQAVDQAIARLRGDQTDDQAPNPGSEQ